MEVDTHTQSHLMSTKIEQELKMTIDALRFPPLQLSKGELLLRAGGGGARCPPTLVCYYFRVNCARRQAAGGLKNITIEEEGEEMEMNRKGAREGVCARQISVVVVAVVVVQLIKQYKYRSSSSSSNLGLVGHCKSKYYKNAAVEKRGRSRERERRKTLNGRPG